MTTNQTIDGVSRRMLTALLCHVSELENRALVDELRALLDAPTPFPGYPPVPEDRKLPAAQPQGHPVAWMYRRKGGECLGQLVQMESDNLKDMREGKVVEGRRILWPREDYIDWKPLYAEQPAPVAVVSGGQRAGKAHLAAQLESLAKQVYQSWESQPGFVPWVDGGNSTKQDEARQIASRTFELALAKQVEDLP